MTIQNISIMRSIFFIFFFICTVALFAFTDPNTLTKVDASLLQKYEQQNTLEYIVWMKDRIGFDGNLPLATKNQKATYVFLMLKSKAVNSQKEIITLLKNRRVFYQSFYVTNAILVHSDYATMEILARRSDVARIIDNQPFKMLEEPFIERSTSLRNPEPEWGIKNIKADSIWQQGIDGKGVVVGGQDTGYEWKVSPLKTKYAGYQDSANVDHNYHWHDAIKTRQFPDTLLNPCGYNVQEPCDDNNHGTHTMGTMVGQDTANVIGVAPGAKWIACRNMDRGWGKPSSYMDCFEWFLAPYDLKGENPDPTKAPHVINNSWYCSVEEGCNPSNFELMEEIVKNLKASGVVVVVSAGNSGGQGCGSVTGPPAFFEPSFSVGASNILDEIAGFSSRGPVVIDSSFRLKPNVTAPGVGVRSVLRNGGFAAFSGTSMAGPHVAGLVALMISANPKIAGHVQIIEDIIEATARPTLSAQDCGDFPGAQVPNAVFGYGIVNALEAVKQAMAFIPTTTRDDSVFELNVFPNPTHDLVTFATHAGETTLQDISIIDINGKLVLHHSISGHILHTIDVQFLADGIYFYHVTTERGTQTGKIVKM